MCDSSTWSYSKAQSPIVQLVENVDENPVFQPGFRQVCLDLQRACDFQVENLVESRIDLWHVMID